MRDFATPGVPECRVCGRDNASGSVAWDEDGVAVPACALHAGCEQVEGEWVSHCTRCGRRCEPEERYCSDECYSLRFAAHRPV